MIFHAEQMKATIIDWLVCQHPDTIIGNEVMYGSKRKTVDLLAVIEGKLVAIEVKSEADSLKRLSEQIEEYKKVFDKIVIVSAQTHIQNIKANISPGIGLYSYQENIRKVLPAHINYGQDKLEMLYSVSSLYLKKMFPQCRAMDADTIRIHLAKKNKTIIHSTLLSFYRHRISERFRFFMNDRGLQTHIDDIPTLSALNIIDKC